VKKGKKVGEKNKTKEEQIKLSSMEEGGPR
jgi:hypothetical protein